MGLLLTVKPDLTLDPFNNRHKHTWMQLDFTPGGNNQRCLKVKEVVTSSGECWFVQVNTRSQRIVCTLPQYDGRHYFFRKQFPLRPGVLVLTRDYDYPKQSHASFRTPEFQAFLDKYGITHVWNSNKPDYVIDNAALRHYSHFGGSMDTTDVQTDGRYELEFDDEPMGQTIKDSARIHVSDASWMLETVTHSWFKDCSDEEESVKERILRTKIRNPQYLEQSMLDHGVKPVACA